MIPDQRPLREEALDWLVKTGDPAFDGWDAFTDWLERSPAHADAYHAAAGDLHDMDDLLAEAAPAVAPATSPSAPRRYPAARWAVAASFAAMAAAGAFVFAPAFTADHYATAAGETRTIALGDGDQLILNGDTSVELSGLGRRDVALEKGQLLLKIASKKHVEVSAGDLQFVDIGTIFEVARDGRQTRLLVQQGSVMADPKGAKVTVKAGEMLEAADGVRQLKAVASSTADAGAWTTGQLTYVDASLEQVAADLHRSTGLALSTSDAMARRRFSGTLSIDQIRKDPASLGPLLGVRIERAGGEWKFKEGG
ncbi:FecR family protein [Sphingomonas jaspsi]|uniref:FecR family protein n=1 Tax=Sphingomonas jaspsi TaxID=392409 RepID=UPI0004B9FAB1|nr:FecR domain-containing protein [Sphingomonas jaspsi]